MAVAGLQVYLLFAISYSMGAGKKISKNDSLNIAKRFISLFLTECHSHTHTLVGIFETMINNSDTILRIFWFQAVV